MTKAFVIGLAFYNFKNKTTVAIRTHVVNKIDGIKWHRKYITKMCGIDVLYNCQFSDVFC